METSLELQAKETAADWTPSEWRHVAWHLYYSTFWGLTKEKMAFYADAKRTADWLEENDFANLTHAMRRIENEAKDIRITKVGW